MSKKVIKMTSIVLMIIMLISIAVTSFAYTPNQVKGNQSANGINGITNVGNTIVGILQVVGVIISITMLIIVGIKYMMGSAEEKAEYKKTLMPYVIGAALIFAASTFAQALYDFFNGMSLS